jgi:hypothetical protein
VALVVVLSRFNFETWPKGTVKRGRSFGADPINLKTVGRRLVEQSTHFAVLGSFLQFPVEIVVLLSRDLPGWRIADRFKFKLRITKVNILSAGLPAKSRPIGDEFSGRSGPNSLSQCCLDTLDTGQ